jgi:hypothetical protein
MSKEQSDMQPYRGHDASVYTRFVGYVSMHFPGSRTAYQVAHTLAEFDRLASKRGKRPYFTKTKLSAKRGVKHRNTTRAIVKAILQLPDCPINTEGYCVHKRKQYYNIMAGQWLKKCKPLDNPKDFKGVTVYRWLEKQADFKAKKEAKARAERHERDFKLMASQNEQRQATARDWGERLGLGRPATDEEIRRGMRDIRSRLKAGMLGGSAELERRKRAAIKEATEVPPDRQAALRGDPDALLALQAQITNKLKNQSGN